VELTIDNLFDEKQAEIISYWKRRMDEKRPVESTMLPIDDSVLDATNDQFIHLIFDYVKGTQETHETKRLHKLISHFLDFGWKLSYLMNGLQIFRNAVITFLLEESTESKESLAKLFAEMDRVLDPIFEQLIEDATTLWENTLSIQKRALLELSAPLIPVLDQIAVMPLIGTIDTERAKLIMENLLNGVIRYRSQVVLIDITGVPIVDSMVAHYIIQASEAVRLVGADCILVGIRPGIAQTIVNLGIDLRSYPTQASLQKGMETALGLTKRKIVGIKRGE
jgi:rsbT co-antagonist protein RsbR